MKKAGMNNLKRSCINYGMLLSITIIFCIIYRPLMNRGIYDHIGEKADWLTLLMDPMAASGFTPFSAIFPILPCAFLFCEEYNSGYIRMILMRTGKWKYCIQRVLYTALSGGLAIFIPFLILDIIIIFMGEPTTALNASPVWAGSIWGNYVLVGNGLFVMAAKLLLAFLFGCTWSLIALAVSTIITNRYAVIIIPFVLFQLVWVALQNSIFNPLFLLRGDDRNFSSIGQVILIEILYAIAAVIFFAIGFWRKMKNA